LDCKSMPQSRWPFTHETPALSIFLGLREVWQMQTIYMLSKSSLCLLPWNLHRSWSSVSSIYRSDRSVRWLIEIFFRQSLPVLMRPKEMN
jgi:hypothetical protein